MKKILFYRMKKNFFLKYLFFISLLLISIYILSFYYFTNKKSFIIYDVNNKEYYIIPKDKEGEEVKFVNMKSINNLTLLNDKSKKQNFNNLQYTIQLFSDDNYNNIENYIKNILEPRSEIISSDHLFVFSIESQISNDYFLTYKNFISKDEALSYCKKLSFVKKCLIVNPQN